jgi:thiamine-monophosphate kinase
MGSDPVIADLGEHALIERIRARLPPAPAFVVVGIGDDAAVIEPERNALEVITTDSQVEGVHFDLAFTSPADVGHKALAVNLSDVAAMGAAPRVALLSLILPPAWPVAHLDALLDGMITLARRSKVSIVGGNIARSPGPLVVDVTLTGSVHRRRVLTRTDARVGDDLYVSGTLGGAALGLRALRANHGDVSPAARRYRRPEPRLRLGMLLGRNRAARACVDLSDGLADGIRQIGSASGVGAVIDAGAIPVEPDASLQDALSGGEDYELLFAVAPKLRRRLEGVRRLTKDVAVTRIGRLTADRRFLLERGGTTEELPRGFTHFGI